MKKTKSLIIFLIVIAIATFGIGTATTVMAVKAGNNYKEGVAAYNQFADADNTVIGDYAAKLAAQAFSATKTAQIFKKQLYKYFAISLLMYLACAISILMIINQKVNLKE